MQSMDGSLRTRGRRAVLALSLLLAAALLIPTSAAAAAVPVAARPFSPVAARADPGSRPAAPSSSLSVITRMAYVVDDVHAVPFVVINPLELQAGVLQADPFSGNRTVFLGTASPYSSGTLVLNYTSGANRSLAFPGPMAGGFYVPGSVRPLVVNGSVFVTPLQDNAGGGSLQAYAGGDIEYPISAVYDYPAFSNETALHLLVPASGLGYTLGEDVTVGDAWSLDGSVLLGTASVSPSGGGSAARYFYRADLANAAYANVTKPSPVPPVESVPWPAPLSGGHFYTLTPDLVLNVPWAPSSNQWTVFDVVNDTWQSYAVPGWNVVWSGRSGNALYLLVQTAWLNNVFAFTLDRLDLTGLTNLSALPTLPVTPILNVSFTNPVVNAWVFPLVSGTTLTFVNGTDGYEPLFGPALFTVAAYNWTTGQSLGNQTLGLSLPPVANLFTAAYPAPGPTAIYTSALMDFVRGRILVLNASTMDSAVDAAAGFAPCGSCQYQSWVTDVNDTVVRLAGLRTDGANRTSAVFSVRALIDHSPPVAAFTVSPQLGNATTVFAVNASAVSSPYAPSSSLAVRWDWNGDGMWDTNWSTTKTAQHVYTQEGTFGIGLEVRDPDGATNETSRMIQVDLTPPTTTAQIFGFPGTNGWYDSLTTVNFTAVDPGDGVASIHVQLNNGSAWSVGNGSYFALFVPEGRNFLRYYATDLAGNVEPVQTLVVDVDATPPTVAFNASAPLGDSGWYTGPVVVTLHASDALSGVAWVMYEIDGGASHMYAAPFTISADGSHTLLFFGTDNAGNMARVSSQTMRIDSTPPSVTIESPTGNLTTSAVTVRWTGSDATSGVAGYELSVDGGAFIPVGTRTSWVLNVSDGWHTVSVRAQDVAGNARTVQTTFHVDANPFSPQGPYGGAPTYAVIAAAVAAVLFLVYRRRKRKSGSAPPEAPPPASPPHGP